MCELEHHLFMLLRVEGIKAAISVNAVLHVDYTVSGILAHIHVLGRKK